MGASMKYVGYYLPPGALRPYIYTYIYIKTSYVYSLSCSHTFYMPLICRFAASRGRIATPSIRGPAHALIGGSRGDLGSCWRGMKLLSGAPAGPRAARGDLARPPQPRGPRSKR